MSNKNTTQPEKLYCNHCGLFVLLFPRGKPPGRTHCPVCGFPLSRGETEQK